MTLVHRLIGRAMRLWWRVRRPRTFGVRVILLDGTGRVALVRHTYLPGWYLPGGGIDKGESAAAAARRELREEVGVEDATIERVLGVYHSRREGKDDHVVVFVARAGDAGALRPADSVEIIEARWFAPEALPDDTSPATRRRIAEYRSGVTGLGNW